MFKTALGTSCRLRPFMIFRMDDGLLASPTRDAGGTDIM